MRILRISKYYPKYVNQFYNNRPELLNESYSCQLNALISDRFMWSDFWSTELNKLGYECEEIICNVQSLQIAWAGENCIGINEKNWFAEILIRQVQKKQPDILFIFDYTTLSLDLLLSLRANCPSIKMVIGWCGAPIHINPKIFKAFDLTLSNISRIAEELSQAGHCSRLFKHAFSPQILKEISSTSVTPTNFSFLGSIYKGDGLHNYREYLIKKLVYKTDLEIWSDINKASTTDRFLLPIRQKIYDLVKTSNGNKIASDFERIFPTLKKYKKMTSRPNLESYVDSQIAKKAKNSLYGINMYQKIYDSNVTLNNHIDVAVDYASNMRLFEATGVGTCLLTDNQKNLREMFEPDIEVVTYSTPEEAVEKYTYLTENPLEVKKIATAGQKRTLKDHTFEIRAIEICDLINSFFRR